MPCLVAVSTAPRVTPHSNGIASCANVLVTDNGGSTTTYDYTANHANGGNLYDIALGTGVTHNSAMP